MTTVAQQFQGMYETLAGKVHVAADEQSLAATLQAIIEGVKPEKVARGDMPLSLGAAVESAAAAAGVPAIKPPYHAKDLPAAIDAAEIGVSLVDFAIAETGTVVEFSVNDATRLMSTLPRVHIALVESSKIVPTLAEAAPKVRHMFDSNDRNCVVSFISGPSRSGDIEMKLTLGVHGPEVSHVIILDWQVR